MFIMMSEFVKVEVSEMFAFNLFNHLPLNVPSNRWMTVTKT
jgi:hypothetical protein